MQKPGPRGVGAALGFITVMMWGTQFTVTKVLFRNLDAFAVTSLRYGFGGAILAGILGAVEGRKAFRLGEHARRAWFLGPAGVVGSVLLAYYGLQHTRPQNAALMVALQPVIMAVLLRVTGKGILPRSTAVAMAVAFVGSLLVIAQGDPRTFVEGGIGWGVILCFFGQFTWVLYTAELPRFTGWSILRTTTLTSMTGGVAVLAVFGIALLAGASDPDFGALGSDWGYVVWMVLGPTVAAIFSWNKGRMLIGAQDIALFMYLIPVVAFVTEALRGYHPNAIEAVAAVVVVVALAADNIAQRRARASEREDVATQTAPAVPD